MTDYSRLLESLLMGTGAPRGRVQPIKDPIGDLRRWIREIDDIRRMEEAHTMATFRLAIGLVDEEPFVPKGKVFILQGRILAHPITRLKILYPRSPVWSKRTVGHREMERDRRLRSRGR